MRPAGDLAPGSLLNAPSPLLAARPEVRLAYLFGSQTTGQVGPMSDIDLALLFEAGTDIHAVCALIAHELVKALSTDRIDLIALESAPIELAHHVISTGICLVQRDLATRVEYEAEVMSRYGDILPYLRAQRRDILQGVQSERSIQRYREALRRTERTLSQITAPKR